EVSAPIRLVVGVADCFSASLKVLSSIQPANCGTLGQRKNLAGGASNALPDVIAVSLAIKTPARGAAARAGMIRLIHQGAQVRLWATQSPATSVSIPQLRNVLTASSGLQTMGSPLTLKLVLSSIGTDVRFLNRSMSRQYLGFCAETTV